MKRLCAVLLLLVAGAWATSTRDLTLPNRPTSLKFAAIGDSGTGDLLQHDVARQMVAYHGRLTNVWYRSPPILNWGYCRSLGSS